MSFLLAQTDMNRTDVKILSLKIVLELNIIDFYVDFAMFCVLFKCVYLYFEVKSELIS